MIRLVLLLTLSLCGLCQAAETLSPTQQWVREGLDRIYTMDFDGSEALFRKALAREPDHPFVHFGLASVTWTRLVYGKDEPDPELQAEFERRAAESIDRSNKWIKKHPDDAQAWMALGGAYGLRGRLYTKQARWLAALFDGRRALQAMRKANKLDPELYDAYLGLGMWEYYADVFPRYVTALRRLVGGDRLKGIEHLWLAAAKARYVSVTAKLVLIDIYVRDRFGSRDPRKAREIVQDLAKQYKRNPFLQQLEQLTSFAAGDFDGAYQQAEDYLRRIERAEPLYSSRDQARPYVVMGSVCLVKRELGKARESFSNCLQHVGAKDRPNWWALWGVLRLAQVEDLLQQRQAAIDHYKTILNYKDTWDLHAAAKGFIKKPFNLELPLELVPL